MTEQNYREQRGKLVEESLKPRGIKDERVIEAMVTVPRHLFIPDEYQDYAYEDAPLPIGQEQTISQPFIVALMVQELKLKGNEKVLEIGTGSGYAAAVLSRITRQVYTIERHQRLAAQAKARFKELGYHNIKSKTGDGTLGWEKQAPFDAILVSAAAPIIPSTLSQQLAPGGRMVIPVGEKGGIQKLVRLTRENEDELKIEELDYVRFVPLIGEYGW